MKNLRGEDMYRKTINPIKYPKYKRPVVTLYCYIFIKKKKKKKKKKKNFNEYPFQKVFGTYTFCLYIINLKILKTTLIYSEDIVLHILE